MGGGDGRDAEFTLPDARLMVARTLGFESWDSLAARVAAPATDPRTAPHGLSTRPPFLQHRLEREADRAAPAAGGEGLGHDPGRDARARPHEPQRPRADDRRGAGAPVASRSDHESAPWRLQAAHRRRPPPSGPHAAARRARPERVSRRPPHRPRPPGAASPARAAPVSNVLAERHHRRGRRQPGVLRSARASRSPGFADRRWRHQRAARQAAPAALQDRPARHRCRVAAAARLPGVQDVAGRRAALRPDVIRRRRSELPHAGRPVQRCGSRRPCRPRRRLRSRLLLACLRTDTRWLETAGGDAQPRRPRVRRKALQRYRHAAHRGDPAAADAHGAGHGGDRRRLRGPQPVADHRVHLGPRVPEPPGTRLRGARGHAGAQGTRGELQVRGRRCRSRRCRGSPPSRGSCRWTCPTKGSGTWAGARSSRSSRACTAATRAMPRRSTSPGSRG